MWNQESCALESGIPLTGEIQNPSSTDKDWNPVPEIRKPKSNTVLDFVTLYTL